MTKGVKSDPARFLRSIPKYILKFIIEIKLKSRTLGIGKFAIGRNFGCSIQIRSQEFSKISKTRAFVEKHVFETIYLVDKQAAYAALPH